MSFPKMNQEKIRKELNSFIYWVILFVCLLMKNIYFLYKLGKCQHRNKINFPFLLFFPPILIMVVIIKFLYIALRFISACCCVWCHVVLYDANLIFDKTKNRNNKKQQNQMSTQHIPIVVRFLHVMTRGTILAHHPMEQSLIQWQLGPKILTTHNDRSRRGWARLPSNEARFDYAANRWTFGSILAHYC